MLFCRILLYSLLIYFGIMRTTSDQSKHKEGQEL